jgi:Rhodopirellula transposase DDE domain
VRHYPAGTSKWNEIEHRLFCHITQNWRGRPLADHATIIDLIAATTTATGLKVEAVLDTTVYKKGIKIRDAEMKRLSIRGDAFHSEWSYTVTHVQTRSIYCWVCPQPASGAIGISKADNMTDAGDNAIPLFDRKTIFASSLFSLLSFQASDSVIVAASGHLSPTWTSVSDSPHHRG